MDYKEAVTAVKNAYDIVDYLTTSGGLALKPNGVGKWKVCCPFHNEKTPSMVINENFQNYHCFGCGVSGDILSYVMRTENLSFSESLHKLADEKGITIDVDNDNSPRVDYDSLYKILKQTAIFYCKEFNKLPEDHVAKKQITDRGLSFNNSDKDFIKYGYAPSGNAVYKMLSEAGFSDELIALSGVCLMSDKYNKMYDFYKSRLMFIITDRYSKPIGFSSRKLYDEDTRGKYVNSVDSPIFHKSKVLYNHAIARVPAGEEKLIYIVEGQFDVASFVEAGLPNVVASSGTAFTADQVNECKKMTHNGKLIFCFDGDEAGLKAAQKIFLNFPQVHEDAFVVMFPNGEDPCDYRLANGSEALKDYVSKPMTLVEFMIKRLKRDFDLETVTGKAKYLEEAARVVKTIPNLTLREQCIRLLSLESLTPINNVKQAVEKAAPITFETLEEKTLQEEERPDHVKPEGELEGETYAYVDMENLEAMVANDSYYDLSVRFINLGLTRQKWRPALLRSASYLPKVFYPFLKELKNFEENKNIFPEMFTDSELAQYLMDEDLSSFYQFMDLKELTNHFTYLHDKLIKYRETALNQRQRDKVLQLLSQDKTNDLTYFKEILSKNLNNS